MVEREGQLESIRRELPLRKGGAGIVDQHIDARLGGGDLGGDALLLRQQRQIGVVNFMRKPRRLGVELGERRFAAIVVAGDEDNPRSLGREIDCRDLADEVAPVITTVLPCMIAPRE